MPDKKKKFYLTTPIYYVNARPHIGHAYTTIAADVIARRHRLLGDDTFFLTGTDEHGQKIERSALAAGIPPQQFADQVSAQFASLWKRMGITNDDYIRTTEPRHKRGVQKLFSQLRQNGFIELRAYTGQYCISDETFVDVPVGAPCPECGRLTETVTEENYFFKLSHFQRQLIDLIESEDPDNRLLIQPNTRKNEVLSFLRGPVDHILYETSGNSNEAGALVDQLIEEKLDQGILKKSSTGTLYVPGALKDLSISRSSFKWGIPVPGDEKHVIYVWLDALANYMTAIGYGSDDPADQARFEKYWPADLHLVGKEIIRFHCVYWPAFLLALRPEAKSEEKWIKKMLPRQITAHGWLLFENDKMSKSKGNIVRTETILDAFGTLLPKPADADRPVADRPVADGAVANRAVANSAVANSAVADSAVANSAVADSAVADSAVADRFVADSPVKGTASAVPQNAITPDAALAAEVPLSSKEPQPPTKAEQDLFASDVLRYFLLREIPFGQDGSFSFDALVQRYNSDLANGYGNLASRTFTMIQKYFGGVVPHSKQPDSFLAHLLLQMVESENEDIEFLENSSLILPLNDAYFRKEDLYRTTLRLGKLFKALDRYISSKAPWKLNSEVEADAVELANVLYSSADALKIITALLYPILPYATSKVWAQLGLGSIEQAAANGKLKDLQWGGLKPGTKLGPLAPIFPRADKGLIQTMTDMEQNHATPKPEHAPGLPQVNNSVDKPSQTHTEFRESPISSVSATPAMNPIAETVHPIADTPAAPETPQIAIDDFVKIDLRVARILVAERIPKADKLLRLEVDLGYEKRQILSGIAQWYTPEELIGRNIVVIANLAPRKMRGLESHGMLLAASHGEDGKPILATFAEDIALGSRLK